MIADAWVPSALKYSVWFAESKWNSAPDPENWSSPEVSNSGVTSMPVVNPPLNPLAEIAIWSCSVVLLKSVMMPGPSVVCGKASCRCHAAGHDVAAGIADQDVIAAAAAQRLGAVGGDDDRRRRNTDRVEVGLLVIVAVAELLLVAMRRGGVGKRTAWRRVIDEEGIDESDAVPLVPVPRAPTKR